jgi:hypothetical protein
MPFRVFYSHVWTPVIRLVVDFDLQNGPSTKQIKQSKAVLADDIRRWWAVAMARAWLSVLENLRASNFGGVVVVGRWVGGVAAAAVRGEGGGGTVPIQCPNRALTVPKQCPLEKPTVPIHFCHL